MSELKVNSIKGTGASTAAITIDSSSGGCSANITNNLSNKNLIINGAVNVVQRGSTSTTNNGPQTADRFGKGTNTTDDTPLQEQVDVASGTTPYTLGFRKAYKITNGNQTSGAQATTRVVIEYKIEAQDLATSGWNYLSSTSYITFSYWVKSSVAQNFYNTFTTDDGTSQRYVTETGSLSADTWTKITKTIPGNSNLTFNNDNGEGLEITWECFRGTSQTGTRPLNAWAAADNNTRTPDQTSTWYTTNDATFEITGVQLEVGSVATDFEHRSFAKELALCQRYYYRTTPSNQGFYGVGNIDGGSQGQILIHFPVEMRSKPTSLETTGTATDYILRVTSNVNCTGVPTLDNTSTTTALVVPPSSSHGFTDKSGAFLRAGSDASFLGFSSEL